jgi:hypothetical protein
MLTFIIKWTLRGSLPVCTQVAASCKYAEVLLLIRKLLEALSGHLCLYIEVLI